MKKSFPCSQKCPRRASGMLGSMTGHLLMGQMLNKDCVMTLIHQDVPIKAERLTQARLDCNRQAQTSALTIGRYIKHPRHHQKRISSTIRPTRFSNAVCGPAKSCGSLPGCRTTSILPRTVCRCPFVSRELPKRAMSKPPSCR